MNPKRIAISVAAGNEEDPVLDPRFGRAAAFLLFDSDGRRSPPVVNPHRDAGHGAGPAVVGWLGEQGVEEVISGEYGPKAFTALTAAGIVPFLAPLGLPASEILRLHAEGSLARKELKEYR